jgi:hypothetical protein
MTPETIDHQHRVSETVDPPTKSAPKSIEFFIKKQEQGDKDNREFDLAGYLLQLPG